MIFKLISPLLSKKYIFLQSSSHVNLFFQKTKLIHALCDVLYYFSVLSSFFFFFNAGHSPLIDLISLP